MRYLMIAAARLRLRRYLMADYLIFIGLRHCQGR